MPNVWTIYKHTNKINGKSYIGQTINSPERRWRVDGSGYKDSPKFHGAIIKYGWEAFTHEVLEEVNTLEDANQREIYWINFYDTYNNDNKGYNMTPGGKSYMSELWKEKEFRENMSASFKKARKKSWQDEEFAKRQEDKLVNGLKKAWANSEWREDRIEAIKGEKNPNSKKVINLETGKIFNTIKEASMWIGQKSVSGIGQCCKGTKKTCGRHPETNIKLTWAYLEEVSLSGESK